MKKLRLMYVTQRQEDDNDGEQSYFKNVLSSRTQKDGVPKKDVGKLTSVEDSKKVVLVDDDPGIRNILQNVLTLRGYKVTASLSDGADLVDSIDQIDPKPDFILLDERMPRMSGVQAAKEILSKYPDIRIIFVSADETAKQKARAAGARAFLNKPVSISELIAVLQSLS